MPSNRVGPSDDGCQTPTEEYATLPIRDWLASLPSADPPWGNCDACGTATDNMVCLGASSTYCHLCAVRSKGYDEGEIETYGLLIQAMLGAIYDHVSDFVPAAHLAAAAQRGAERFAGQRERMSEED